MVAIWPKGSQPRRHTIASLRARLMARTSDPIGILYRIACGAVDDGRPMLMILQPFRDFIAQVEAYAARRERQSAGVIAFPQVHVRLVTRSIREDCEADVATAGVDLDSIASLEKARAERLDAIAADERLVEGYTQRIAELRARG